MYEYVIGFVTDCITLNFSLPQSTHRLLWKKINFASVRQSCFVKGFREFWVRALFMRTSRECAVIEAIRFISMTTWLFVTCSLSLGRRSKAICRVRTVQWKQTESLRPITLHVPIRIHSVAKRRQTPMTKKCTECLILHTCASWECCIHISRCGQ